MCMEDILAWLTITVHIIPSALETGARAAMSLLETEKHAKLVSNFCDGMKTIPDMVPVQSQER